MLLKKYINHSCQIIKMNKLVAIALINAYFVCVCVCMWLMISFMNSDSVDCTPAASLASSESGNYVNVMFLH